MDQKTLDTELNEPKHPFDLVKIELDSLAKWRRWLGFNSWITDPEYIESIVATATSSGFIEPLLGPVAAADVSVTGSNYRETISYKRVNSRMRAVLLELATLPQ